MHVCTHICIITYICSSGFPAKLLPCVVHYPRAPSRKAETHLWGQGVLKPISPGPKIHKTTLCTGPTAHSPSTGKFSSTEPHKTSKDILVTPEIAQ